MEPASVVLLVTAAVVAWMALTWLHRGTGAVALLAALVAAPVFLKVSGGSIAMGDALVPRGSGQTFPIGVLAVPIAAWVTSLRLLKEGGRWAASPLSRAVAVFVGLNLLALLAGLVEEAHPENLLFLLQVVGPTVCYFVGLAGLREIEQAKAALVACAGVIGGSVTALVVYTVLTKGILATASEGTAEYLWIFPMYAEFDYLPLVVAVGYGVGLALVLGRARVKGRVLLFGLVVGMLLSLFVLRSKGALLTAVVLTVAQAPLFLRNVRSARMVAVFAVVGVAVAGLLLAGPGALTIENIKQFAEGGGGDASLRARLRNVADAADELTRDPVLGMKYVPRAFDVYGQRRLANPHNQYLSYGVRGGLPLLAAFLAILGICLARLWRLSRDAGDPSVRAAAVGLFSVFLGVALVSNFLQDNFIQPHSGCVLWLLMGVGEFLCLAHARAARAMKRVPAGTTLTPARATAGAVP